ncbi:methyltransferase domain-containing protein [Patescibacteria group bacterium]|nr:methyltransferase domain-containing protein [Patescibacteria group bacterium]MBU0964304.1 methyltransferase domain-containing protein [Patescibacteria group bacterium]
MQSVKVKGNTFLNPEQVLKNLDIAYGEQVVDMGCGGGYFVLQAARIIGNKGTAYGVDILKSALSSLKSKALMFGLSNVRVVWSDAEVYGGAKNISDSSSDLVLLVQLLSQVKKRHEVFREAVRILKKGGRIAVLDWKENKLSFGITNDQLIPLEEVKELAVKVGLRFFKEIEAGPYHFGLVFKK